MVINRCISVGVKNVSKFGMYPAFIMSLNSCGGSTVQNRGDDPDGTHLNTRIDETQTQLTRVHENMNKVHQKLSSHTCAVPTELPEDTIQKVIQNVLAKKPLSGENDSALMESKFKKFDEELEKFGTEIKNLNSDPSKLSPQVHERLQKIENQFKEISLDIDSEVSAEIYEALQASIKRIAELESKIIKLEQAPTKDKNFNQAELDRLKRAAECCMKINIVNKIETLADKVIKFLDKDVEKILDPRFNLDLNMMVTTFEASTTNNLDHPIFIFGTDNKGERNIYKIKSFDFSSGKYYEQSEKDKANSKFTLIFSEGDELSVNKSGQITWVTVTNNDHKKLVIEKKCKIIS